MKQIRIRANGYEWHIRADAIANHRANYYVPNAYYPDWLDEFQSALEDDYELLDWYQNNMNWSDVAASDKKLVKSPEPIKTPDDLSLQYSIDLELDVVDPG